MNPARFLVILAALFWCATVRAEVTVGDTRAEALRLHGTPKSSAKKGSREYFVYANGSRIEFTDGKVADIKGTLPVIADPLPAPASASAAITAEETASVMVIEPARVSVPAGAAAPSSSSAPRALVATPSSPLPAIAPAPLAKAPPASPAVNTAPAFAPDASSVANAAALAALGDHIEKMDTAWGESPKHHDSADSPFHSIPAFLVGLVLRFGLTVAALKLAFRYWEMDALWRGVFAIAGIDLALHAILELLGPLSGGVTAMPAVANGLPGVALIFTIKYFCFNKRLQNAVLTASAVKGVVSLLYIFGGLALLNAAF